MLTINFSTWECSLGSSSDKAWNKNRMQNQIYHVHLRSNYRGPTTICYFYITETLATEQKLNFEN